MKIYIDTNWFLSFYQANQERQGVLDLIAERAHLVVMTDQNRTEFRRNRASLLQRLRENIIKSTKVQPYTTSILLGMPEHGRVLQAARDMSDAACALLDKLTEFESALEDKVSRTFNELLSKCTVIRASDEDVVRAQCRKARGIPPSTSKRSTIGDELIWECLLRGCEEDLAIVSLDGDFLEQGALLADEFSAHPSRRTLIHIGDRLADVLSKYAVLTPEEYAREQYVDPIRRCSSCGADSWYYAGQDRNSVHLEKAREHAGYPPLDDAARLEYRNQRHVYVCGQCNSLMFL